MGKSSHRELWAANLKTARLVIGKTQQELAAAVGTNQAQISLWESARSPIGVAWLAPLAAALGSSVFTLFPIPGVSVEAKTNGEAA